MARCYDMIRQQNRKRGHYY